MATNPCTGGRRLSDLLQEQQEPFLLLHHLLLQDQSSASCGGGATPSTASALGRTIVLSLRGGTCSARNRKLPLPLRWAGDLATCFPFPFPCGCAGGSARQRSFPRLTRADDGDDIGDCGRQLGSPVSALDLDLHSDAESPVLVLSRRDDEHDNNDEDGKPSKTSSGPGTGTSAPPSHATERFQRKTGDCSLSLLAERGPEAVVSAWETIAADISRIPSLVQLDMSSAGRSLRDGWTRLAVAGEEEEEEEQQPRRQVGQSIEAMIFEEVRWDAVRDMLDLPLPACHTTSLTNS